MRSASTWLALILLTAGAAGCTVTTESPPPAQVVVADGTLTVDWTIDEAKDSNLCAQSSTDTIEVRVTDAAGGSAGTYEQSCDAFATSISLPPGDYSATAVLLDGGGAVRTTTVSMSPFSIHGGDELVVPIDFPASSFH